MNGDNSPNGSTNLIWGLISICFAASFAVLAGTDFYQLWFQRGISPPLNHTEAIALFEQAVGKAVVACIAAWAFWYFTWKKK